MSLCPRSFALGALSAIGIVVLSYLVIAALMFRADRVKPIR